MNHQFNLTAITRISLLHN